MEKTALKEEQTAVKKKRKGKKALKIIGMVFAVIVFLCGVCAVISAVGTNGNHKLAKSFTPVEIADRIVPEKDSQGHWVFTTDREMKILQLTDVHLGGGFMSLAKDAKALTALAAMVQGEKPDLVITTGDIAYPVPFQAGTFNNKTGAKLFAEVMNSLGVYWTVCFGNHDSEIYSYFSRDKISDFYESTGSEYCLYQAGPADIDGYGNQIIKIKNSKGEITQALFLMDTHSYINGDYLGIKWEYDGIHPNQTEWYRNEVLNLKEENGGKTVNSMVYLHIPPMEFKTAWDEFTQNGYKDTKDIKYKGGIVGETGECIYSSVEEDEFVETMLELGSTKALLCGHDHYNNVTLNYKGIDLSYGNSIDYLAYIGMVKKGSQRGCTVITVSPDGHYEINKYNLYSSGRYTLPEGFDSDVVMQFEGVTYQYVEEK